MGVVLKNPNAEFPENGWRFSDPHTGYVFNDPIVDLNFLVKQVIDHRIGNPRVYPPTNAVAFTPELVKEEIIIQLCASRPQLCEDSAHPGQPYPLPPSKASPAAHPSGKKCPKCQGLEFEPIRCRTCGGGRISGYKCRNCGYQT